MNATDKKIIAATWLVTANPANSQANQAEITVLNDHGVLIIGGKIIEIAPYATLCEKHADAKPQFLSGQVLLPGLINCHGHAAMSLLRGAADDLPLQQWLEQHIWPTEAKWVSADFVADGVELAIAEMLLSGTTTFADMYFFPDVTARIADALGMRAQVMFPVLEFASAWAEDADHYIDKGLALFDQYRYSEYVNIGFAPHAPYTVSDASFSRIVMLAEEVDAAIQLHLHETANEVAESIKQYGVTPIQRLLQLGVLSPRTQAVHLTQLNDDDLQALSDTDTSIIHCPTSNQKLASGFCNVAQLQHAGIRVGLGTDSAASNNTLDMFSTMRCAALLAKHQTGDATQFSAQQTLYLATLGGAKALGIDNITGSISEGKSADLIAVDLNHPAMQPVHNPISQLVYTHAGNAVSHVWIEGQAKVANGKLLNIDTQQLLAKSQQWAARIANT